MPLDQRLGPTRAMVIYSMNALANSQLEELATYMPDRPGGPPAFAVALRLR